MDHTKKTITYVAIAAGLALIAWLMAPSRITPEAFLDQGEEFYPDFTDPNEATTLEVIDYDEATATANPFKVESRNGLWTIPSHHSYPADGKTRLAQTAAAVIGIKKDEFRSDNQLDHETFGVLDPLDAAGGLTGRGRRVTLKKDEAVLADFIIGNAIPERQGFHYVRVPGQNRVYACRMNIEISTRFEDWIETDLLELEKHRLQQVVLKDYSINERTRSVEQRDVITVTGSNYEWDLDKTPSGQMLDSTKFQDLLATLDALNIVGVRPKPEGLSTSLKRDPSDQQISQSDAMNLQRKGFYFSREGNLLSNEGELQCFTNEGIRYTLRFGEVVYGSGEAVTAGGDQGQQSGPAENRYLFVTAAFDPSSIPEPPGPTNKDFMNKPDSLFTEEDRKNKDLNSRHNRWEQKMASGEKRVEELNNRFADWYYVISSESFDKLHLSRRDLLTSK